MYFAVICRDKPGALSVRMESRPAHLEYLKAHSAQIPIGGPLMSADGQTPCGSLIVVEAEDEAAARALLDADPYNEAGLFESVTVQPWRWVVGKPDDA